MSRIGKQPIAVNDSVKVSIENRTVKTIGSKGVLEHEIPESMEVVIDDKQLFVKDKENSRNSKALHGLTRSLLANMVTGVAKGFQKDLEIQGVGYRAQASGKKLTINIGYSHPIEYVIPDDVSITVVDNTKISVSGIDKQRVGQVAATIRQFRKPEPYKGKGIRYANEVVKLKEGKTV